MTIRAVVTVELAAIEAANNGVLTKEDVVEAARSKKSPLHNLFEWDNKIAGEKYRLGQAAQLIRIVREEIGTDQYGESQYVRVYTSARQAGREEPGYLRTSDVLLSPISEAILVKALKREIGRLTLKYGHLQQYGAIVRGEIEELTG